MGVEWCAWRRSKQLGRGCKPCSLVGCVGDAERDYSKIGRDVRVKSAEMHESNGGRPCVRPAGGSGLLSLEACSIRVADADHRWTHCNDLAQLER